MSGAVSQGGSTHVNYAYLSCVELADPSNSTTNFQDKIRLTHVALPTNTNTFTKAVGPPCRCRLHLPWCDQCGIFLISSRSPTRRQTIITAHEQNTYNYKITQPNGHRLPFSHFRICFFFFHFHLHSTISKYLTRHVLNLSYMLGDCEIFV